MKIVYVRDVNGRDRAFAFVCQIKRTVLVCPIDKFNDADEMASLEFAVGFPVDDVRASVASFVEIGEELQRRNWNGTIKYQFEDESWMVVSLAIEKTGSQAAIFVPAIAN